MNFEPTEAFAQRLDEVDELAGFRKQFYLPPGQIYLVGNSLGLLPKPAEAAVLSVLDDWKQHAIEGWTNPECPWFFLAETLGRQLAPLIDAEPEEVIVTHSTTVNLHQLLATLFEPAHTQQSILADELAFPSDIFAIQSHLRLRGLDPESHLLKVKSRDGYILQEEDIITAMTPAVQLAVLPAVQYTSGQLLDMERLTQEAHARGILIGFDCSHSIGSVPHRLSDWEVDFAFWCSYKYLNGGPGAAGGLYLNRRHFGKSPGLAGWFSSDKNRQFDMTHTLVHALHAGCMQIGSPHILNMAPLIGSFQLFEQAGMERLRRKSLQLTAYLMALIETLLPDAGFSFANPREEHRRGGHVALVHPEALRISQSLRELNVVPDFRPPDIIRLAPTAFYNSFSECYETVIRLKRIMDERLYERRERSRGLIS
jgi:kynureninase